MNSKAPSNPFTISRNEFRPNPNPNLGVDLDILLKQFKDVWASLAGSHEIFASDFDLLLIVRHKTDLPCRRTEALMPGRGL
jgi:hypothetical protein